MVLMGKLAMLHSSDYVSCTNETDQAIGPMSSYMSNDFLGNNYRQLWGPNTKHCILK